MPFSEKPRQSCERHAKSQWCVSLPSCVYVPDWQTIAATIDKEIGGNVVSPTRSAEDLPELPLKRSA
jgi:hypothetical protein